MILSPKCPVCSTPVSKYWLLVSRETATHRCNSCNVELQTSKRFRSGSFAVVMSVLLVTLTAKYIFNLSLLITIVLAMLFLTPLVLSIAVNEIERVPKDESE